MVNMSKTSYGITPVGVIFMKLGIIRAWEDGDTFSFEWNYLHPVTYLIVTPVLILGVIRYGVKEAFEYSHEFGIGLSPYWKANKDSRRFIRP